jgi:hypothetical protein
MATPLMPKATAIWLLDNTALTFAQIAAFCGLHLLEIKALADGEVSSGLVGFDPVLNGQLTQGEIDRCSADENAILQLLENAKVSTKTKTKSGKKYTPLARRSDRPDAILWLIKNYPQLSDTHICMLLGTTRGTIASIRDKTHWNIQNIKPHDPVILGICSQKDLEDLVGKSQ